MVEKNLVSKLIIYSKEQIRTLLQAAYEYHSIYLEVLLALFAGLRKGEIMDVYINIPEETVHDCEKEMTAFMADILPKTNLILDIRIPEKDLLEFLPSKAYNMVS